MGQAQVSEGAGAMAARHRGESVLWSAVEASGRHSHLRTRVFQEEYEDSSGNVVNKKTYEDLKRQGLL